MRKYRSIPIFLALSSLCACKVGNGSFDQDGSFFDRDAGFHARADAGHKGTAGAAAKGDDGGADDDAGSAHVTPKTDAGHTPTPEDVPAMFAQAVCSALETCLGPVLLLDYLKGTPCVELITRQQAERDLHWLSESIAAGRVLFRTARLDDCMTALKGFGCDVQSRRLPQSCLDALEGQVALHQPCSIDYDCVGGAYCDKGLATETCPGSCSEPQSEALPCNASVECADRLICRAGSCVAPLKEGDDCETSNGQPTCPPGLVCQGPSAARKCQTLGVYAGKLGDTCDAFGTLCEVGLVCESVTPDPNSPDKAPGVCKQPVSKDSTCRRALPNECPSTQYCKSATLSSSAKAQPGEDGVCADLPVDGGSCTTLTCAPGTVCVNQTCRALQMAGGPCESAAECYSASCDGTFCTLALDCQL